MSIILFIGLGRQKPFGKLGLVNLHNYKVNALIFID